jgi:COP9 signalosome complex subunit 5
MQWWSRDKELLGCSATLPSKVLLLNSSLLMLRGVVDKQTLKVFAGQTSNPSEGRSISRWPKYYGDRSANLGECIANRARLTVTATKEQPALSMHFNPRPTMSAHTMANLHKGESSSITLPPSSMADSRYSFDPAALAKLKQEKPWMASPKYFEKVALSPSAIMKMMMHCASGVQKGIAKGGNPIEVMGLLLGRPDPNTPKTLIITDAFPLPIEGFETRVIADDQEVVNHMISLNECLERTRKENFMGWYHSHPFDVGDHSHCFLSQTDLSTQLQWQRAEDPHGNPFVAIVLDPLRSLQGSSGSSNPDSMSTLLRGSSTPFSSSGSSNCKPELKAFRAYPPEYSSPTPNECPDGSIQPSEQVRLEHWGSCWNRYYELEVEYYMSSVSRNVLEQLTRNYLWMKTLQSNSSNRSDDTTKQSTLVQTMKTTANQLQTAANTLVDSAGPGGAGTGGYRGGATRLAGRAISGGPGGAAGGGGPGGAAAAGGAAAKSSSASTPRISQRTQALNVAVSKVVALATDELYESTLTHAKQQVFRETN